MGTSYIVEEQTSIKEKISKYVFSNLLSVLWTISLLAGGIIFWLYFSEIQYFPDLAFDESVLFLIIAAKYPRKINLTFQENSILYVFPILESTSNNSFFRERKDS